MTKSMITRIAPVLLAVLPVVAFAHTGHESQSFIDGFVHPFFGADHLLAMLLVGAWSVLHGRQIWLAPLTFVSVLAAGALLGQNGLFVPQVELLVAASVLALGIMLARPFRLSLAPALVIIGGFAISHGMAHGSELPSGSNVLAGIVLGSTVLHVCGMAFAHLVLMNRPKLTVRLGQLVAVLGGGLMLSSVL